MKKLLLTALLMLLCSCAYAEPLELIDLVKKIPDTRHGIAYSMQDNEIQYLSTVDVIKWKALSLEAGFSTEDKLVAVASIELIDLGQFVDVPILKNIMFRPGIYYGCERLFDNLKSDDDWGVSATVLEVKF